MRRSLPFAAATVGTPTIVALALAALLAAPVQSALHAQTVWPDEGPRTWTPRPTEAAITANDLRTRLYQFADDSMMGREAGTLGNIKGHRLHRRRVQAPRADSRRRERHVLPEPRLRYGWRTTRTRCDSTWPASRSRRGTDWAPLTPNPAMQVTGTRRRSARCPPCSAGAYGDPTLRSTRRSCAARWWCSPSRRSPPAARRLPPRQLHRRAGRRCSGDPRGRCRARRPPRSGSAWP